MRWWIKTNSAVWSSWTIKILISEFTEHERQIFYPKYPLSDSSHDREKKPVVTEKFDIEYEDESKSLAQLDYSEYQNPIRTRLDGYLSEYNWPSFNLLIEALTKKIRLLVTEKFQIDYGDEPKLLAHLDSSEEINTEARIKTIFFSLNITA